MSNSAQIVIGVILLISAVFLIIAILMQDSKNEGLSSAITGADNTSFGGKTKSKKLSGTLSKVTTIVAICFVLVVILLTTVNRSLPTPEIDGTTTTAATTTPAGEETTSTTKTPTEETTPASATPTEETPTPTESVTPSSATETQVTPADENA